MYSPVILKCYVITYSDHITYNCIVQVKFTRSVTSGYFTVPLKTFNLVYVISFTVEEMEVQTGIEMIGPK